MSDRYAPKSLGQELKNLRRLWPYLRKEKTLVYTASILVPIIALLEMYVPIIIKHTIDEGISQRNWDALKSGASIYLVLVVAQYVTRSIQSLTAAIAVHRMILNLRNALIAHVLKLSSAYHDRSLSGALVTRATSDFDNLSESLNTGVLTSVIDFAVLTGSFVGLVYLDWKLALYSLVLFPVVALVVSYFSRAMKATMLRARAKIAELNAFTQECLYGSSTIKLLNAQPVVTKRHDTMSEDYRREQMGSVMADSMMFSIIDGLTSITVGIILLVAVLRFTPSNAVTAGVMIAFVQYVQQMFEPVKQLSNKIAMLQGAFTSIDRVFGVMDSKDFIGGSKTINAVQGRVSFDHVSFAYRGKDGARVISDLSFEVGAGQSLAIVGATGSGKSTIIKLLTKQYEGYTGSISIDEHDLVEVDGGSLRRHIAIVPQDIVLFDGSIEFNISLGLPGVTREDVISAARSVGADSFIREFPLGYDQAVKEQGSNLSHGMRQLIAFARALAKKPSVIVLDEATSSVDPESEALIQKGIETLLKGHTVIVIAHRLSTIRNCDQIMVLEKGQLIEKGHHTDLIAKKGSYFSLHEALI